MTRPSAGIPVQCRHEGCGIRIMHLHQQRLLTVKTQVVCLETQSHAVHMKGWNAGKQCTWRSLGKLAVCRQTHCLHLWMFLM